MTDKQKRMVLIETLKLIGLDPEAEELKDGSGIMQFGKDIIMLGASLAKPEVTGMVHVDNTSQQWMFVEGKAYERMAFLEKKFEEYLEWRREQEDQQTEPQFKN